MRATILILCLAIFGCSDAPGGSVMRDAGADLAHSRCGDNICSANESPSTCCEDCGCTDGQTCQSGQCRGTCGDGVCSADESSTTCCDDCGCANGYACQSGRCETVCGDGICNGGETESNCCDDCGCPSGYECSSGSCTPSCGDGVCSAGETPSTCCQDCGCTTGYACQSGACQYVGTSSLYWTIADNCFNGDSLELKFFDETDKLIWPSYTTHYVQSAGTSFQYGLNCTTGDLICYGATEPTVGDWWGVSVTGAATCTNCCVYCTNGSLSTSLVCN